MVAHWWCGQFIVQAWELVFGNMCANNKKRKKNNKNILAPLSLCQILLPITTKSYFMQTDARQP